MPKLLVLIRHPEAEKNVLQRFSRSDGGEAVTKEGRRQSDALVASFRSLVDGLDRSFGASIAVHSAATVRSVSTAEVLAGQLGCTLERHDGLMPISAGSLAGLTEDAARSEAPAFSRALELYRAGVLSSYRIPGYGESVQQFEARVANAVDSILCRTEPIQLVVAHRSPITATLIRFARTTLDYPTAFYGYIELDLGGISALLCEGNRAEWVGVNKSPTDAAALLVPIVASLATP